jgi:hypothetical protein
MKIQCTTLLWWLGFLLVCATSLWAQTQSQDAATDLSGTTWQLVEFQGSDGTTLTPDDRSKYTSTYERDGQLSARLDCNRGRGTWNFGRALNHRDYIFYGPSMVPFRCPVDHTNGNGFTSFLLSAAALSA